MAIVMEQKRFGTMLLRGLLGGALLVGPTHALSIPRTSQDGPVSVTYGDVYKRGEVKIEPYDLTTLPPLPAGYSALNNRAYKITTTAIASGPHIINFSVASVTNREAFDNLQIFHAEPDTFDPDSPVWVRRTVLFPDTPAPNFFAKTVSATSELGVFVIATLIQKIPQSHAFADLAVTCSGSPETAISPSKVTFVVKVTNKGPQLATDVGLINGLPNDGVLVSMNASQGKCKEESGSIYCKLGTIAIGSYATLTVVVKPNEGTVSFPPEGKTIVNSAWIAGNEADNDVDNNHATGATLVFPDPNMPPSVTIDEPKTGALYVGPADITIKATAIDSDGRVAKVEFLDNGELIGSGIPSAENRLAITEHNVAFGYHSILAIVTDNAGRQNISNAANIIVNGPAILKILKPLEGSVIVPGSAVTLTAHATHPSGSISKVEFFASGQTLGEAVLVGANKYELRWNKIGRARYSIVAVATDATGITTTTAPVELIVTKRPIVSISNPSESAAFPSLYNINITAKASADYGRIEKVDFYANGLLIGSSTDVGTDRFMMTWRRLQDGVHSLTAVATDELGVTSKSEPVKISVGKPSSTP